jgi:hypothetical protein
MTEKEKTEMEVMGTEMGDDETMRVDEVLAKYAPKQVRRNRAAASGGNGSGDPAPSATALHHERMAQLVGNISLVALDELRAMRDQVDSLMTAMHQRRDTVLQVVQEYTGMSQAVVDTKQVIGNALGILQAQFDDSKIAPTLRGSKVTLPPVANIEPELTS